MAGKAGAGSAGRDRPAPVVAPLAELLASASGGLLATMLDAATDGIAICDANGHLVFVNAVARRLTETGETGAGTSLDDAAAVWGTWCTADGLILPPREWPIARALRGEVIVGCEMYKQTADARPYYLRLSASPVRDPGGRLIGAVCITTDIDRLRRAAEEVRSLNASLEARVAQGTAQLERAVVSGRAAAEELARNRQLLHDVVNHTDSPIFLKDTTGRYLLVNRAYEALFRIAPGWIVGRTDLDLFSPDVAHTLRANDARVLASDQPIHMEEVVPVANGQRIFLSVKFPLRDADGTVYGVGGIATDITERTRIAADLARSQALLTAVIDSSGDAIWAVDGDRRLVMWNGPAAEFVARIFRSPIAELTTAHAVPDDVVRRWQGYLERALAGERFVVEETIPDVAGPRHLLTSLNPTLQDGQATGVAVFSRDVTDLRRAEDQARQHQAELAHALRLHTMGEMIASLAHEVNQPLGAIANYANGCRRRIERGDITTPELLPWIEAIAREALRAGTITRRLRTILRKEETRREPVEAAALLEAAVGLVEPAATRRGVTIDSRPPPPLPHIVVDPIQIEQVVLNLLLNAVEATGHAPGLGHVEVRLAAAPGGHVEVAVADDGPGVDPALGERIFEPFLTTKPNGLGMGLAISRSIVDAHGGRLWVTDNPGGGAVFRFTVPTAQESVTART